MIRFINWQYRPAETGWLSKENVKETLKEWELAALEKLKETNADHIVYAYKEYVTDKDGKETYELNLMLTPLSNDEFYKRTASFGTNYLIYALHKGTNL